MLDVVFVVVPMLFFAVAATYVAGCRRLES